jgi:hypothetical protein
MWFFWILAFTVTFIMYLLDFIKTKKIGKLLFAVFLLIEILKGFFLNGDISNTIDNTQVGLMIGVILLYFKDQKAK